MEGLVVVVVSAVISEGYSNGWQEVGYGEEERDAAGVGRWMNGFSTSALV